MVSAWHECLAWRDMTCAQSVGEPEQDDELRYDPAVEVLPGTHGYAKLYRTRTTPFWMAWEVVLVALMWAAIGVFFK